VFGVVGAVNPVRSDFSQNTHNVAATVITVGSAFAAALIWLDKVIAT
jgi:hypothetical protein